MRLPVSVAFSRVMVALVVAMSLPTLAWADTKIAVVDLQKVLKSTNAGKAAQKKFDDLRDKKKASLEAKGKSMEKRQRDLGTTEAELAHELQELQAQGKQIGEDLKKRGNEFQESVKKFQQDVQEFEKAQRLAADELAKKEGDLLKPIEDTIKQKVEAIAKEQGFSMVLSRQVAIYVAGALDITGEVIKRCDGQ